MSAVGNLQSVEVFLEIFVCLSENRNCLFYPAWYFNHDAAPWNCVALRRWCLGSKCIVWRPLKHVRMKLPFLPAWSMCHSWFPLLSRPRNIHSSWTRFRKRRCCVLRTISLYLCRPTRLLARLLLLSKTTCHCNNFIVSSLITHFFVFYCFHANWFLIDDGDPADLLSQCYRNCPARTMKCLI